MASFITTMSVPSISISSADEPAPRLSSSPSRKPITSVPPTYNTVHVSNAPLSAPPSYLSPAVRALKQGLFVLTPPSNARTRAPFKPRSAAKGTTSYQLRQFAEATLGSGSLRKAVKLPEGEDVNEWLAVNGAFVSYIEPGDCYMLTSLLCSGRLLQPSKPSLRSHHRILLAADMPRNESDR